MAKLTCQNPEAVVKEAMWLAWQACGGPRGMGVYQNAPDADKEAVWANVRSAGDYTFDNNNKDGQTYADYVFGRMMKVGFQWGDDWVSYSDSVPRSDYQGWCRKYKTYEELVKAADAAVNGPKE